MGGLMRWVCIVHSDASAFLLFGRMHRILCSSSGASAQGDHYFWGSRKRIQVIASFVAYKDRLPMVLWRRCPSGLLSDAKPGDFACLPGICDGVCLFLTDVLVRSTVVDDATIRQWAGLICRSIEQRLPLFVV